MAKKHATTHLTPERIQAFLDEALSREERARVEEHATFCVRCQAELEAWQFLYSELRDLPELSPAPSFRDRVLAGLGTAVEGLDAAVPTPSAEKRLFGWSRRRVASAAEHVSPERFQDFVEGLLPARQMARVATHLDTCGTCRSEEEQWRGLIQGIEQLPMMAPSDAFARQVMGQIRIGRLVRPVAATSAPTAALAARTRALAWAGRLIPRTQKAWAVVSGVALTPATVVGLLAYAVFSNPLVTPQGLASFVWWKISAGATALGSILADGLVESGIAFQAYSLWDLLVGAPAVASMVAVSLCAATSLSGWVLYRNLITTHTVDGNYARTSS